MFSSLAYILVLITDVEVYASLIDLLRTEEFKLRIESTGTAGVAALVQQMPSLIIMSEDMPSVNDMEMLPLLRRLSDAPIIVVGSGGETEVVNALLQGADHYLTWPANYREFLSRVRALLRRSGSFEDDASSSPIIHANPKKILKRIRANMSMFREHLAPILSDNQKNLRGIGYLPTFE